MTIKTVLELLEQSLYKDVVVNSLQIKDQLTLKELKPLGFTQSSVKYHVARGHLRVFPSSKKRQYLYSVEDVVKLLTTFKTKGNVNPKPRRK